ncbi:MAG: S49 family peptidase [Nitrosomonas sp.]|nr:S49 family peptidase [Nitrosomonas sp.]MCP5250666.1 S49 family peptidase [Burkholderiales bacterium]MCP5291180.1 S49 family peptidase [Burkholderiales bacterium]HQU63136.1 S49 family peptidase [Nitrosomonas sp.]
MTDGEEKPVNPKWERQLIEGLAFSALREQRRARIWGIFFKSLTFIYLFILLLAFSDLFEGKGVGISDKHTALIDVNGTIMPDGINNADNINASLRSAFKDSGTQGVILRINSPGGSPVQAGYINDEIRRLRANYPEIPLYAVIGDICASGGYYIAAAADKIFVDKASLVGSIGVLMDGFGFTGTMEKLGVERRLFTAGEHKGFLDPFSPLDAKQREHLTGLLNEIHEQFIRIVQQGRGDRLKDTPEIFSGVVWTGKQSIELGLADEMGSAEYVAREVIKAESIVNFSVRENLFDRFTKRVGQVSMSLLFDNDLSFR